MYIKTVLKRILFCTIFFSLFAYADIPIHVMPNTGYEAFLSQPAKSNLALITKQALIHEHIDIGSNSPYASVTVQLIQTSSERYLLAHLMSRYVFSYHVIRINLNTDNTIHYPILKNYKLAAADTATYTAASTCPAQYQTGKPLFVVACPGCSYTNSISRPVIALTQTISHTNQYQLVTLFDKNATVQNYQNIFACPNLKYFAHFGGSDDYGQAFDVYDGDFNANYFSQNPQLNLSNKGISFDSCNLFDQVKNGFCPILGGMEHSPLVYSSGSSQLLIWGSAETYACFWEKVVNGASPTQSLLNQCALAYDPSVPNSQSGIYFLGDRSDDNNNPATIVIQTNHRIITVKPDDYTILKLNSGEMVTQYAMKTNQNTVVCTPDPTNRITLFNNPNLSAAEFILNANDNSCEFTEISRLIRNGNLTRDIYGIFPKGSCFHLPNKPKLGELSLSSKTDLVDMMCNGTAFYFNPIPQNYMERFDWKDLASQFNANQLDCVFSLYKTHTEISSLHINIRPSAKLPGLLAAQISDVKSMNGYSLPTITYSGPGDAEGYHGGIGVVINSK